MDEDKGPGLTDEQKQIIKRQGTHFLRLLGSLIAGLETRNPNEAMTYLRTCVSKLRDEIKRRKSLFGRDGWLILREEEILARLGQEVFTRQTLAFHFPEVRGWLWDNGYDETGERKQTMLNFRLPDDEES